MIAQNNMRGQLELFEERLPQKPYCTNELGNTIIRTKSIALKHKYIQANQINQIGSLVFDIDHEDAMSAWFDDGLPPPSIIVGNPANGHAHLTYLLKTPVHSNPESRRNPLRYAAAVEATLRDSLQADHAYAGVLTKNPLHKHWITEIIGPAYELAKLNIQIPKKYSDLRKKLPPVGLGRNVTAFDIVRNWAYKEIRKPQGWFGYEFWFDMVFSRAMAVNENFAVPLSVAEIKGIAKSIAKWTWERFSPEGFKDWCSRRGKASGRVRKALSDDKLAIVIEAKANNPQASNSELSRLTGIPRPTVIRLLRVSTNHIR